MLSRATSFDSGHWGSPKPLTGLLGTNGHPLPGLLMAKQVSRLWPCYRQHAVALSGSFDGGTCMRHAPRCSCNADLVLQASVRCPPFCLRQPRSSLMHWC